MRQEFEEMASALREHVRTLEEEKAAVVSERESLENELRATIRSNESDWNGRIQSPLFFSFYFELTFLFFFCS